MRLSSDDKRRVSIYTVSGISQLGKNACPLTNPTHVQNGHVASASRERRRSAAPAECPAGRAAPGGIGPHVDTGLVRSPAACGRNGADVVGLRTRAHLLIRF